VAFVHGPGTDDPLMGNYRSGSTNYRWYWVTDGQGRQFAVGDSVGYDRSTELQYEDTGIYAGGTTKANTYDAERNPTPRLAELSFFRNRFYDQETGQWTQEDPIGIAGGINLYQYAGNNPVSFSDPFGLRVCFAGSRSQVRTLKGETEEAIGATISLDRDNCVKDVGQNEKGDPRWRLRRFFLNLHESEATFAVRFSRQAGSEQIDPYAIDVFERAPATAYWTWHNQQCNAQAPFTYAQVVAHELSHHNPVAFGRPMDLDEQRAVGYENLYLRAVGRPERCRY
jgi:RHS repeat-associated protein